MPRCSAALPATVARLLTGAGHCLLLEPCWLRVLALATLWASLRQCWRCQQSPARLNAAATPGVCSCLPLSRPVVWGRQPAVEGRSHGRSMSAEACPMLNSAMQ